jgi:Spy/CpxP family protein refolding chaperone
MKRLVCTIAALCMLGGAGAWAQVPPEEYSPEGRFLVAGGPGRAWAQQPPSPGAGEQRPRPEAAAGAGIGRAMEEFFFPPELVMRNQGVIGLREEQQKTIRAEMGKSMAQFTDLQWQQSAQVDVLQGIYKKQPVDEKEALAQFDKLLALENEIKRLRLATLIRVKNVLTPEQQALLRGMERPGRRTNGQMPMGMQQPAAPGR